ncbi:uncharacterized protein LOC122141624 [Cyprinus carpio]|uniref:Uncharacterized protein LOC122141624 n=1 Tax=Cyprinus carpio TaxID=7962 RepID=A0A9Q9XP73_CYPCA|nr:uncharacterized protein LOC122141624 [Cyprinus carpio]
MFDRFWFCLCLWRLVGVFADTDTVKPVSVKEGDSVTLQINVTEIQADDEITWTFGTNRNLIAKISGETSDIGDVPDGRFRDRLKLDHQTGSLNITDTRTTDSGLYEVEISSRRSDDTHRFSITVYAATTPDPQTPPHPPSTSPSHSPAHPSSRPPVFLIVLISAAAAAAGSLVIVAVILMFCIKRKHRPLRSIHEDENQAAVKTLQTHWTDEGI